MPASIEELRPHLQAFDFRRLFVEGLGWDYFQGEPLAISVDGYEYALKPVAEKAQFAVFECAAGSDGAIPDYPLRRKIETQVTKRAFEHLVIFVDVARTQQVWQWVKRQAGKPTACREHRFNAGQTGQPLLQRLDSFLFTLEDEAKGIGIGDVTASVAKAFDVEKVTKRFYDRFRTELTAFGDFIEGITAQGDRDWYASLMLNRMMFVYFVQKQGFLDGDANYLRNRLKMVQALDPTQPSFPRTRESIPGRFQRFYRLFLLRLFHEGLGQPEAQRAPDLAALLGRVPFLNGGLFDQHELERENPDIVIPDAAFERVFDFFDGYRWHLDERPYREDNEINPDVLGYIFEKYVNQKQMGAYYTKEDITGYISRNTVIPFLFDAARKECPVAFGPDGGVWRLLHENPDRYIYPAVGHGIAWNARQSEDPKRLEAPFDLPDDIAVGIDDVSKRGGWNASASEDYALPTETWREVVARRQRYEEVKAKLQAGEVQEINDLITLNLDLERFAKDVIAQSEEPELLRAFWHALYGNRERSDTGISVLDPTCGSGAFLFAALNVLEPLYTACLEGMRGFLDDLRHSRERGNLRRSPNALSDFREILGQVDKHPSERYFILKSIVLNNLYGVDIMEEAVEICKLRLFLKLVAQLESYDQIEPLPDIDFNVRAGNTLVGFTSLEAVRDAMTVMPNGQHRQVFPEDQAALDRIVEDARGVDWMAHEFRRQQIMLGGEVTSADKQALGARLRSLADKLDRLLAAEYGVNPKKSAAYDAWRDSHQPFHWFVEFYGIMSKGGFDVVIGNPPYVEYSKVRREYRVRGFETERCGNLYAMCVQRFIQLLCKSGMFGVIVPISAVSTPRMLPLMRLLASRSSVHIGNFAVRPGKLFVGVDMNLSILIGASSERNERSPIMTTTYNRWNNFNRDYLFNTLSYVESTFHEQFTAVMKSGSATDSVIIAKLTRHQSLIRLREQMPSASIFYHSGGRYFRKCIRRKLSNEYKELSVREESANPMLCLLSSSLYYWLWTTISDCYHVTRTDIDTVPVPESLTSDKRFSQLADALMDDFERNAEIRVRHRADGTKRREINYLVGKSKGLIDQIDCVLAEHYGFTEEELDFIINYDIKYRMGRGGVE